jgi:hypothetical protein
MEHSFTTWNLILLEGNWVAQAVSSLEVALQSKVVCDSLIRDEKAAVVCVNSCRGCDDFI